MQEIDRENPGGPGVQALMPGLASQARHRSMHAAEGSDTRRRTRLSRRFRQFAVAPARCPTADFYIRRRMNKTCDSRDVAGRPGVPRLLIAYFFATSLPVPDRNRRGVTRKTSLQRRAG